MSEIFENNNKLSILSELGGAGGMAGFTTSELCGFAAAISDPATTEAVLSCAKYITLDAGPRQRV